MTLRCVVHYSYFETSSQLPQLNEYTHKKLMDSKTARKHLDGDNELLIIVKQFQMS